MSTKKWLDVGHKRKVEQTISVWDTWELVEKKVEHKKQSFTREKEEKGEKEEKQKKKRV